MPRNVNLPNVGANASTGLSNAMKEDGKTVYAIPVAGSLTKIPAIVTRTIPIKIPPLTPLITNIKVTTRPISASIVPGVPS